MCPFLGLTDMNKKHIYIFRMPFLSVEDGKAKRTGCETELCIILGGTFHVDYDIDISPDL